MMKISSLNEQESGAPTYKIIILGMPDVGKSALLLRYLYKSFREQRSPTICIDCSFVKRQNAKFAYFDTAGQDRYRTLISRYFKGSDAAILTYNINDEKSFEQLEFYRKKVEEEVPDCRMYLVGCKGDLEQKVSFSEMEGKFSDLPHFITSAKLGEGVQRVFGAIEQQLLKSHCSKESFLIESFKSFKSKTFGRKKKCCG